MRVRVWYAGDDVIATRSYTVVGLGANLLSIVVYQIHSHLTDVAERLREIYSTYPCTSLKFGAAL